MRQVVERGVLSIDNLARNFFWRGTKHQGSKFTLMAWNSVYKPKEEGGLAIRKMEHANVAMLCKLGWALESNSNSLWVKSLKAKYFPHTSFMNSRQKKTNSW